LIWKKSDSQNWHNRSCNEQNCIGYRLEPNLHKKKAKGIDYDFKNVTRSTFDYVKESQYMTKAQYKKALAEIRKIARKINPNFIVKKGDKFTGMYLTLVKNDPYNNHSIRVYHYGYNVVTDIQLQFADKTNRKHIKRIMVTHLHRFEFGISTIIRHYCRIYKNGFVGKAYLRGNHLTKRRYQRVKIYKK